MNIHAAETLWLFGPMSYKIVRQLIIRPLEAPTFDSSKRTDFCHAMQTHINTRQACIDMR